MSKDAKKCPKCGCPFTDKNPEVDTGLCDECRNKIMEDADETVCCPSCGKEFIS